MYLSMICRWNVQEHRALQESPAVKCGNPWDTQYSRWATQAAPKLCQRRELVTVLRCQSKCGGSAGITHYWVVSDLPTG